jgi:hypothetical protein
MAGLPVQPAKPLAGEHGAPVASARARRVPPPPQTQA